VGKAATIPVLNFFYIGFSQFGTRNPLPILKKKL